MSDLNLTPPEMERASVTMTKHPHRSKGRRRSVEQEQERESRLQLALAWKDWPLQTNAEDLGEDLLFQIYAEGNFTGLSIYIQLKSTTDIDALVPKRNPKVVAYSFETKDLVHWENSVPPVVLLVWDVVKNEGVWLDVPEALSQLDAKGRRWRKKGSGRVLLPRSHTTDDQGRDALRATIAHLALPVLSKGKEIRATPSFSFPKTPEGQAALEALQRTLDEGGTVTIGKEHIVGMRMSAWWERAYGVRVPDSITFSSHEIPLSVSLRLQAVGPERTESLDVELRRVKTGLKRTTFETPENSGPIKMTLILHEQERRLEAKLNFAFPCETVQDSLRLARLLIANKQGGTIQIVLPDGAAIGEAKLDVGRDLEELLRWETILQKLCYIEGRVARFGRFTVRDLSEKDIPAIERLHGILQSGEWRAKLSLSFAISDPKIRENRDGPIVLRAEDGEQKLLGVRIPLGKVDFEFLERQAVFEALSGAASSGSKSVTVNDAAVVGRFRDWEQGKMGPEHAPTRVSETTRRRKKNRNARRLRSAR